MSWRSIERFEIWRPVDRSVDLSPDAYLIDYQDRLSAVVAIEVISQQLEGSEVYVRGNRVLEPGPKRTIESEVSFGTLPGEAGWLGFRRVRRVDRRSIRDTAESIDALLRGSEPLAAAKKLLEQVRTRGFPIDKPQTEQVLLVKFKPHAGLGLLVPVEMREVFGSDANGKGGTGVARYRDFRRFETSGRIVPPI